MMTLSEYLVEAGMTQREFSRDVGVSPSHLNEIVRGAKDPSLSVARRIADRTGGKVPITAWPKIAALAAALSGSAA